MHMELTSIGYLENIDNIIYTLKIMILSLVSYYTTTKILNIKIKYKIISIIAVIIASIISSFSKALSNLIISVIVLILLLSWIFSKISKQDLGYSILVNTISLSINYIFFILAVIISFIPYILIGIENELKE